MHIVGFCLLGHAVDLETRYIAWNLCDPCRLDWKDKQTQSKPLKTTSIRVLCDASISQVFTKSSTIFSSEPSLCVRVLPSKYALLTFVKSGFPSRHLIPGSSMNCLRRAYAGALCHCWRQRRSENLTCGWALLYIYGPFSTAQLRG